MLLFVYFNYAIFTIFYNFNYFTSKIVRLKIFNSTNIFRRHEIRSQILERMIVLFNLSSYNIINFNNNQLFFFIENRVIEFFDNVQFKNFNEIDNFIIFENINVVFKHISIFEFIISNVK